MSGFLHRLAAQAMGSTNTLRSAVRRPYSPLSPVNRVEPDTQVATLNPIDTERQHRDNGGAERASVANQAQQYVNTYSEIGTQPRNNEIAPSSPEILVVKSDTGLHTKPNRSNGVSSSAKAMLRQSSIEKTVAGELPVLAEEIEMRVPGNDSTTLPESNYPTPLLPLKNAARLSALNASAAKQRSEHGGSSRQGQADEITEVHVSIGRIEVTAVQESSPPKRQTPTSAKPLSLDEYLARRGKKT
ncbi:MAG: hypothetical protein Q8K74_06715 [Candidatus Nitrotoga sp.]|nr:hypothetical protein [Candidatus Nitrotoga sp.]MDP1855727.1 hypothetical protein [Candidatus Nitrotoga sp.]